MGTPSEDSSALEERTIRELHRRMFDRSWAWAGRYRTSDRNVGVHWPTVPEAVGNLLDDARHWFEQGTYGVDEAALRLHRRLVKIHPFPNGNGRHARLWSDMILTQHGRRPFDWKNDELDRRGEARRAYIAALRSADQHDYGPLLTLILAGRDS